MSDRLLRLALPILVLALGVVLWDVVVRLNHIPPYVLPAPTWCFRRWSPTARCSDIRCW